MHGAGTAALERSTVGVGAPSKHAPGIQTFKGPWSWDAAAASPAAQRSRLCRHRV